MEITPELEKEIIAEIKHLYPNTRRLEVGGEVSREEGQVCYWVSGFARYILPGGNIPGTGSYYEPPDQYEDIIDDRDFYCEVWVDTETGTVFEICEEEGIEF